MKTSPNKKWIVGEISTPAGEIPRIESKLTSSDKFATYKVRWGFGRSRYRVEPGLYAVGNPTDESLVFVSANYKMSFDCLRSNNTGLDCWIMVLDTKGINVWCAAGKGTFGTDEIVRRIEITGLNKIVSHRKLILPMLGAPGVSAHKVREQSGFHVIYGPIRAKDIPAFLKAGKKNTPEMRQVKFTFADRAVLIPNELVQWFKYPLLIAACFLLLSGFGPDIYLLDRVATRGIENAVFIFLTYFFGMILPPLLLPWLPGRPFSLKGAWVGIALAVGIGYFAQGTFESSLSDFGMTSWYFIIPSITSFIAMNFTGSSTFTSLSGVKKEMRVAVPIQISFAVIGVGLWVTGLFV
ncbi:MAG: mercury methylation corrinoid protein HgcA [candidate division Zixibacteria bacterium]